MRILAKFTAWLAPIAGGFTAYKLATIVCFSLAPMLAPGCPCSSASALANGIAGTSWLNR